MKKAVKCNADLQELINMYGSNMYEMLKKEGVDEKQRQQWIHLSHLLDIAIL